MTETLKICTKAEEVSEALNGGATRHEISRMLAEAADLLKTASNAARQLYEPMFVLYRQMNENGGNIRRV